MVNTQNFDIQASAHAFEILSSGIYKDSLLSIVRELCSNAHDAHVAADITSTPFQVHVPSDESPYFRVKDYGPGMSHDDIMSIYTTYFASTKSHDDAYIGSMGLGSKSPFSYAREFSVTSHHDSVCNEYLMKVGEDGIPTVELINTSPTNTSGIIVSIDIKHSDIIKINANIRYVLSSYRVTPQLINAPDLTISAPSVSDSNFNLAGMDRVYYLPHDHYIRTVGMHGHRVRNDDLRCVVGQNMYTVKYSTAVDSRVQPSDGSTDKALNLMQIIRYNAVLVFDSDAIDMVANREELKLTQRTLDTIHARITDAYDAFHEAIDIMLTSIADTKPSIHQEITLVMDNVRSMHSMLNCHKLLLLIDGKHPAIQKHTQFIASLDMLATNSNERTTTPLVSSGAFKIKELVTRPMELPVARVFKSNYPIFNATAKITFIINDCAVKEGIARAKEYLVSSSSDQLPGDICLLLTPTLDSGYMDVFRDSTLGGDAVLTSTLPAAKAPIKKVGTTLSGTPAKIISNKTFVHAFSNTSISDKRFADGGFYYYHANSNDIYLHQYSNTKIANTLTAYNHKNMITMYAEEHPDFDVSDKSIVYGISKKHMHKFCSGSANNWVNIVEWTYGALMAKRDATELSLMRVKRAAHADKLTQIHNPLTNLITSIATALASTSSKSSEVADLNTIRASLNIIPTSKFTTIINEISEIKLRHNFARLDFVDDATLRLYRNFGIFLSAKAPDHKVDWSRRFDLLAIKYPMLTRINVSDMPPNEYPRLVDDIISYINAVDLFDRNT